MTAYQEK